MTDQSNPHTLRLPADRRDTTASELASFIYVDLASAWGFADGIASFTLEALRLQYTAAGLQKEFVTVAHLRMGLRALSHLKKAIEAVEVMAENPPETMN